MSDQSAHVDPKLLRDFGDQLAKTIAFYKTALEQLNSRMGHLSQSWRDKQFEEFKRELVTTQRILEEFIAEATTALRNLLADAERAEAAQKIRLN